MSLINEALRKARQEAAHKHARSRGVAVPSLGRVGRPRRRRPRLVGAAIAGLLVAVAALATLFVARPRAVDTATASLPPDAVAPAPPAEEPTSEPEAAPESAATASEETRAGGPLEAAEPAAAASEPAPARPERRIAASQPEPSAPEPASAAPAPPPATPAQQLSGRPDAGAQPDPEPVPATRAAETGIAGEPAAVEVPEPAAPRAADATGPLPLGSEALEAAAEIEHSTDSHPASYHREADLAELGTFRLDGIAWSSERPFALVNGEVVGPGGYVDGAQVVRVEPDKVLLALDEHRILLRLR